jgi:hypothetical protein
MRHMLRDHEGDGYGCYGGHGIYGVADLECAIGLCETAGESRFSRWGLREHLKRDHGLDGDLAWDVVREAGGSDDKKARAGQRGEWRDCLTCVTWQDMERQREGGTLF